MEQEAQAVEIKPIKPKKRRLTKKQKGFIRDYVRTGNGTKAALNNYDTDKPEVANAIAVENLQKPLIQETIKSVAEYFSEEFLAQKHLQLLNSTRIDHLVFPLGPDIDEGDPSEGPPSGASVPEAFKDRTKLTDQEITSMLAEVNCTVRQIVHGETARHVYFWSADNRALRDALDMAYKLKGTYAPEKRVNVNIEAEADDIVKALADKLNHEIYEGTDKPSDGTLPHPVDDQAQAQERDGGADRVQ